jgi:hypothetical protein
MPRAEHASRQALRLFPRATVTGNANDLRPRCYPALSCPMRSIGHANAPSGTAIRSTRRSLPGIQRTPRSPAAVLVYLYPDGERADEPALHPDARSGSSTVPQWREQSVRTHAVPRYPGLLTPRAEHASRQAPQWSAAADGGTSTLRSYCAGSAIGETTVIGDADAAPNP